MKGVLQEMETENKTESPPDLDMSKQGTGLTPEIVASPEIKTSNLPTISPGSPLSIPLQSEMMPDSPSDLEHLPPPYMLDEAEHVSESCAKEKIEKPEPDIGKTSESSIQTKNEASEFIDKVNVENREKSGSEVKTDHVLHLKNSEDHDPRIIHKKETNCTDSKDGEKLEAETKVKEDNEVPAVSFSLSSSSSVVAEVAAACATSSSPTHTSEPQKRGLVSRRGGRAGAPSPASRSILSSVKSSTSNFSKSGNHSITYRSECKRDEVGVVLEGAEKDHGSVPMYWRDSYQEDNAGGARIHATKSRQVSLCTTSPRSLPSLATASETHSSENVYHGAIQISSSSSSCSHFSPALADRAKRHPPITSQNPPFKDERQHNTQNAPMEDAFPKAAEESEGKNETQRQRKPFSITVKPCNTSPLESRDIDDLHLRTSEISIRSSPSRNESPKEPMQNDNQGANAAPMSPPPTSLVSDKKTNGPGSQQKQSMGQLPFQDSKLSSPCALFLSPYSPASLGFIGDSPFVRSTPGGNTERETLNAGEGVSMPIMSPTLSNRDRTATGTPINFGSELDGTNPAFSWLNSPTTMFPLTPKSGCSETPHRDIFQDAKFENADFSNETSAPRPNSNQKMGSGSRNVQNHQHYSNMICISPLAPSKKARKDSSSKAKSSLPLCRSPHQQSEDGRTSVDIFQEMFASPRPSHLNQSISPSPRSMLSIDFNNTDTDPRLNLDLHMAERDLMEDEDLSVLLHLASNPNNNHGVSRSPFSYHYRHRQRPLHPRGSAAPTSLQLPLMGDQENYPLKNERDYACSAGGSVPVVPLRSSGSKDDKSKPFPAKSKKSQHPQKKTQLKPQFDMSYGKEPSKYQQDFPVGSRVKPIHTQSMPPPKPHPHPVAPQFRVHHPSHSHSPNSHLHRGTPDYPSGPHRPTNFAEPHSSGKPFMLPRPSEHAPHQSRLDKKPLYPYANATKDMHARNPNWPPSFEKNNQLNKRPSVEQKGSTKKKQRSALPKKKVTAKSTVKHKQALTVSSIGDQQKPSIDLQAAAASGGKNAQAAALAAAILRGVTMRPSGKWQAQLYYAGKSRYIGVFDSREKAALAYEIAREKLKSENSPEVNGQCAEDTEAAVNLARKAAFEGVNEPDPRLTNKR